MLLITGSAGLIGCAIGERLTAAGIDFNGFDVRDGPSFDTRNFAAIEVALQNVTGIVHLAAVSRVVWAEEAPAHAQSVNVDALDNILRLIHPMSNRPWLIFASSREVYGEQASLPVAEDAILSPVNTYARTKVAGERLVEAASADGIHTQIVRFSNVYGTTDDHADRVVPAFARTAAAGGSLRVDGSGNTFDFTHVDDAADGLFKTIEAMIAGEAMPPLHFLTGTGTTLADLAGLAEKHALRPVSAHEAPSRKFDVSQFVGDPRRAEQLLGWKSKIGIDTGFARLVGQFAAMGEASPLGAAEYAANAAASA